METRYNFNINIVDIFPLRIILKLILNRIYFDSISLFIIKQYLFTC